MSFSFYASSSDGPDLSRMGRRPGLLCEELDLLEGPMHEGQVLHVYLDGITTRSVEIAWENSTFQVRIMTMACHEDYTLAISLVCDVAHAGGCQVRSEEDVVFEPRATDHPYNDDWIGRQVESLVGSTLAIVREHGEVVMSGANTTVVLTPAIVQRLVDQTPMPSEQATALFRLFREVNFPADEWFKASQMAVTLEVGSVLSLVVWGPGVAYQFAKVDAVALITDTQVMVPWSALAELAGSRLSAVDGATVRISAVPEEEWPELLGRAEPYVTTLEALGDGQPAVSRDMPEEPTNGGPQTWMMIGLVCVAIVVGLLVWSMSLW